MANFDWEKLWKENKHLLLIVVMAICAYLLWQKSHGQDLPKIFSLLPLIGGAAYGLNFLTTLTK